MKINKHIEIVRSGAPRLSSLGLKSCTMLQAVLSQHYRRVGVTYINDKQDLARLIATQPDLAYLGFKSMPATGQASDQSPDIWICEQLDAAGINYTGSTKAAMLLDHNKDVAKQVVLAAGLLSAPYFSAKPSEYHLAGDLPLPFPLFIKPPQEGGGKGIADDSIVRDFAGFERKVAAIEQDFGTPALVETYLTGREFSVALLGSGEDDVLWSMPVELITQPNQQGDQILSRKVKSDDTEHAIAVGRGPLRQDLNRLAEATFRALGARDYGRIDIRMGADGQLYFLEANLIPGVAQHDFTSYFTTACWLNRAMDYEAMILQIVGLGLTRQPHSGEIAHALPLGLEPLVGAAS